MPCLLVIQIQIQAVWNVTIPKLELEAMKPRDDDFLVKPQSPSPPLSHLTHFFRISRQNFWQFAEL